MGLFCEYKDATINNDTEITGINKNWEGDWCVGVSNHGEGRL